MSTELQCGKKDFLAEWKSRKKNAKKNFFNIHLAYWIERVMRGLFHLRSIWLSFQLSEVSVSSLNQ